MVRLIVRQKKKIMQRLFFLFILTSFSFGAFAQNFTDKADSDPAAKAVLEKMRQKYEGYNSLVVVVVVVVIVVVVVVVV